MCWNEQISWLTFLLGTAICTYGWSRTKTQVNQWIYFFFQLVLLVQLGEALIWRDPTCGTIGKIGTFFSFFGVWLQPMLAAYILTLLPISSLIVYGFSLLVVVYIIVSLPTIQNVMTQCYVPICEGDCLVPHISFVTWTIYSPMGILYMVCILGLLAAIFPFYPIISLYVFCTMILSGIFYKNSFGSMWCWFGAFAPVVCLLVGI